MGGRNRPSLGLSRGFTFGLPRLRHSNERRLMRLLPRYLMLCAILMGVTLRPAPAQAQLRGHGGPVRALAISADGAMALSGSFDASAIRWSLKRDAAEQVLRFHDSAVDAVAILRDGRCITAGEDGRIAIWAP